MKISGQRRWRRQQEDDPRGGDGNDLEEEINVVVLSFRSEKLMGLEAQVLKFS